MEATQSARELTVAARRAALADRARGRRDDADLELEDVRAAESMKVRERRGVCSSRGFLALGDGEPLAARAEFRRRAARSTAARSRPWRGLALARLSGGEPAAARSRHFRRAPRPLSRRPGPPSGSSSPSLREDVRRKGARRSRRWITRALSERIRAACARDREVSLSRVSGAGRGRRRWSCSRARLGLLSVAWPAALQLPAHGGPAPHGDPLAEAEAEWQRASRPGARERSLGYLAGLHRACSREGGLRGCAPISSWQTRCCNPRARRRPLYCTSRRSGRRRARARFHLGVEARPHRKSEGRD